MISKARRAEIVAGVDLMTKAINAMVERNALITEALGITRAQPDPQPRQPREGKAFSSVGDHDDTISPSDVDSLLPRGRRHGRDPFIAPQPDDRERGRGLIDETDVAGIERSHPTGERLGRLDGERLYSRDKPKSAAIDGVRVAPRRKSAGPRIDGVRRLADE